MDEVIVHLTIDGELIETTFEHPFYTADGRWVHAGGLAVGTRIRRLDGGSGSVEAVATVSAAQPMFNLTVAEARTFFVGDGAWLVHNVSCPLPLETGNWENRHRGKIEGINRDAPGIYEYRSGGILTARIYVGMSQGQSVIGRLLGKPSNYGRNIDNVVWSAIYFPSKYAAQIAERVRIEQLLAMPNVGINGVVNAALENLNRTKSRAEAIEFMSSGKHQRISGWPEWLVLPPNMIELPPGWK